MIISPSRFKRLFRVLLIISTTFIPAIAFSETEPAVDISHLDFAPKQPVSSSYKRNFEFHHDKGFYLSASIGPQWNQSLKNPEASALRFGGGLNIGGMVIENLALHGSFWSSFLEESTLIAVGPGLTYFFGNTNAAISWKIGIGQVFNVADKIEDFKETLLATEIGFGKYWWLSGSTSLGGTIFSGLHGYSFSQNEISSFGWSGGIRLELIFN